MKQLNKQQQKEAIELIENIAKDQLLFSEYIESAKAFLQSLKPKIYVCINNCGTFFFFSKDVLNDEFSTMENDAHRFESIEQAQIFIDEYVEKDYPMYVVIA